MGSEMCIRDRSCTLNQYPGEKEGWSVLELIIADNGIGMSEEFQKHIFESFSQERSSSDSGIEGSGLGMGIVKKLVDLMNGKITVQSKPGAGSTFTITLPLKIANAEERNPKHADGQLNIKKLEGKRVLLVEDNDLNAEIATELLTEEGIMIERAENGVACIDMFNKAKQNYYSLILMDIQMQFMDGMTAAEEIRKFDTKVVIMFITNMTNYAIRGYEVDAMDYVLKPVTYFSFARKLERAISRIPQKTGKPVKVNTPDGVVRIDAGDVYYIESEGHNLIYHTSNGTLKERAKMQDAAGKFEPLGFFRSNKGYLVNLEYVEGVKDGCCTIQGEALLISRARKNDFMTALAQYMGEH